MPARDTYRPEAREAALEALDEALQLVASWGPVLNGVPTDQPLGGVFAELQRLRDGWAAVGPADESLTLHYVAGLVEALSDGVNRLARPLDAVAVGRMLDQAGVVSVSLHRAPAVARAEHQAFTEPRR